MGLLKDTITFSLKVREIAVSSPSKRRMKLFKKAKRAKKQVILDAAAAKIESLTFVQGTKLILKGVEADEPLPWPF